MLSCSLKAVILCNKSNSGCWPQTPIQLLGQSRNPHQRDQIFKRVQHSALRRQEHRFGKHGSEEIL